MSHNGVSAGSSSGAMQLKTFPSDDKLVNKKESRVCSPCHGGGRRRALIPYATGGGCGVARRCGPAARGAARPPTKSKTLDGPGPPR